MTVFQSIVLGIVQGLTEFLPISSSGHLVIVPRMLGWELDPQAAFVFDVLVQVATLVAVIAYFYRDLAEIAAAFLRGLVRRQPFSDPMARLGWLLILASVPAGLIGLLLKDQIEAAFNSLAATGFFLIVTAVLLLVAERAGKRLLDLQEVRWQDALLMGIFQALAVFPGVSRSGATITGGMLRDLKRPTAARFSFLMSVPIMLAAGLLAAFDLREIPNVAVQLPAFLPGFAAAAVVGYLSIRWLLQFLTRHPLYLFSVYCASLGLLTLMISLLPRLFAP